MIVYKSYNSSRSLLTITWHSVASVINSEFRIALRIRIVALGLGPETQTRPFMPMAISNPRVAPSVVKTVGFGWRRLYLNILAG